MDAMANEIAQAVVKEAASDASKVCPRVGALEWAHVLLEGPETANIRNPELIWLPCIRTELHVFNPASKATMVVKLLYQMNPTHPHVDPHITITEVTCTNTSVITENEQRQLTCLFNKAMLSDMLHNHFQLCTALQRMHVYGKHLTNVLPLCLTAIRTFPKNVKAQLKHITGAVEAETAITAGSALQAATLSPITETGDADERSEDSIDTASEVGLADVVSDDEVDLRGRLDFTHIGALDLADEGDTDIPMQTALME